MLQVLKEPRAISYQSEKWDEDDILLFLTSIYLVSLLKDWYLKFVLQLCFWEF